MVNLGELLRLSWKSYESKAVIKNLQVTVNLPEHMAIKTDQRLLRLIFNNLFSNAINYTPDNGILEITAQDHGDHILFAILNSSPNVTAQDISHFFERFWRKDKVRGASENMGLGLSITQILCRRLQIHLTVSSPKPDFVCFWLNMPVPATSK